jgi:hypothetical protein
MLKGRKKFGVEFVLIIDIPWFFKAMDFFP